MVPVLGSLEDSWDARWPSLAMSPAQTVILRLCNHFVKNSDDFYSFPSPVPHTCSDLTSHWPLYRGSFLISSGGSLAVAPPNRPSVKRRNRKGLQSAAWGLSGEFHTLQVPSVLTSSLGVKGMGDLRAASASAMGRLRWHYNQNPLFIACFIYFFKNM